VVVVVEGRILAMVVVVVIGQKAWEL